MMWLFYKKIYESIIKNINIITFISITLYVLIFFFILESYFPKLKITFNLFGIELGLIYLVIPFFILLIINLLINIIKIINKYIPIANCIIIFFILYLNYFGSSNLLDEINYYVNNFGNKKLFYSSIIMCIIHFLLSVILPIFYFGILCKYENLSIIKKADKHNSIIIIIFFILLLTLAKIVFLDKINLVLFIYKFSLILLFIAIPEELIFRGIIINWIKHFTVKYKNYNQKIFIIFAVLMSSILFFLMHYINNKDLAFSYGIFIFLFGILSSIIYINKKTILYSVILHTVINLFS